MVVIWNSKWKIDLRKWMESGCFLPCRLFVTQFGTFHLNIKMWLAVETTSSCVSSRYQPLSLIHVGSKGISHCIINRCSSITTTVLSHICSHTFIMSMCCQQTGHLLDRWKRQYMYNPNVLYILIPRWIDSKRFTSYNGHMYAYLFGLGWHIVF